jgi:hypothetical protein
MGQGENVQTDVLLKIYKALKCDITEIMEIEYNESDNPQQLEAQTWKAKTLNGKKLGAMNI